jgi:hypothetical protein
LDQRESDLKAREDAVTAAEAGKKSSTFGDGMFEVGRDIQPGKYSPFFKSGLGRRWVDCDPMVGPSAVMPIMAQLHAALDG